MTKTPQENKATPDGFAPVAPQETTTEDERVEAAAALADAENAAAPSAEQVAALYGPRLSLRERAEAPTAGPAVRRVTH